MSKKTKAYFDPDLTRSMVGNADDPGFEEYSVMSIYQKKDGTFSPMNIREDDTDVQPGSTASLTTREQEKSRLYMEVPAKAWKSLTDEHDKLMLINGRDDGLSVANHVVQDLVALDVQAALAMGVRVFDAHGKGALVRP